MNANVSTTLGPASSILPAVVCLSLFGEVRDGVTTKYYTQQFVVLGVCPAMLRLVPCKYTSLRQAGCESYSRMPIPTLFMP